MKVGLFYFSLTGNTELCAKTIKAGIDEALGMGHCELYKTKDDNPKYVYDHKFDLIGIGSPTWGGPAPPIRDFIRDMIGVGKTHAFAFHTHGTVPQLFAPKIYQLFKEKQMLYIGCKGWYGDHPQMWAHWPYPTAGHPDAIDLAEMKEFGKEMVDRSQRIKNGEINLLPPEPVFNPEFHTGEPITAVWEPITYAGGAVHYHKEKCLYPECKLCMENCWSYSLDLSLDPPRLQSPNCGESCCFCSMVCPTGAMEMDDYLKAEVPNYFKIEPEDAFPNLKRDELAGKFRRLVPEDKVGSEGAFCEVYTGHPKWITGKHRPGKKTIGGHKSQLPKNKDKI